jgi:hypothetical protein
MFSNTQKAPQLLRRSNELESWLTGTYQPESFARRGETLRLAAIFRTATPVAAKTKNQQTSKTTSCLCTAKLTQADPEAIPNYFLRVNDESHGIAKFRRCVAGPAETISVKMNGRWKFSKSGEESAGGAASSTLRDGRRGLLVVQFYPEQIAAKRNHT